MGVISENQRKSKLTWMTVIVCCSALFSLLTVFFQQQYLGLPYLETGNQIKRHLAVLEGTAPNAWQFRVLSDYLVEGVILIFQSLNLPRPVAGAFLSFRLFQNTLIFLLAALYYKRLGLNTYLTLIGLSILAWGMTHALYNSDLQFSNYFEVIFYLSAGLVILYRKDVWIIPLTVLAALNRETCGLIPFMLLADRLRFRPQIFIPKRTLLITAIACASYVIIFIGLRYIYGMDRPVSGPVGFALFKDNVLNYKAWAQLFATLGIVPIMAIAAMRQWPHTLKAIFLAVIPVWFIVIPFTGGIIETRHYLVPQALVFIPGALLGVVRWNKEPDAAYLRAA